MCICFPSHAHHAAVLGRTVVNRAICRSETGIRTTDVYCMFWGRKQLGLLQKKTYCARGDHRTACERGGLTRNCKIGILLQLLPFIAYFFRHAFATFCEISPRPLDSNNFDGEASSTVKKNRAASAIFTVPAEVANDLQMQCNISVPPDPRIGIFFCEISSKNNRCHVIIKIPA